MLVDKQSALMSDLLFTVHQHGGYDVTWKPPIVFTKVTKFQRKTNYAKMYLYNIASFDVLQGICTLIFLKKKKKNS